jgi:hypothetical protein
MKADKTASRMAVKKVQMKVENSAKQLVKRLVDMTEKLKDVKRAEEKGI